MCYCLCTDLCVNEVYDGCVIVCVQTCVLMKSMMGVLLLCTDLCVNEVYDGCVIVCVQLLFVYRLVC